MEIEKATNAPKPIVHAFDNRTGEQKVKSVSSARIHRLIEILLENPTYNNATTDFASFVILTSHFSGEEHTSNYRICYRRNIGNTWDFYLQAHHAPKGTVRPAHYSVVLDEIFRAHSKTGTEAADELEKITYNMCHLFARATKSFSLCPPAYYADIVCERARCHLASFFDPSDDTLYPESSRSIIILPLPCSALFFSRAAKWSRISALPNAL